MNTQKILTKSIPIGIDLGTTISCVCAYIYNKVEPCVIDNNILIPSYIDITKEEIGNIAKKNINDNTFYNIKRFLGKPFDNNELQQDLKYCPFRTKNINNELYFECGNKDYNIIDIDSLFLKQLKIKTEEYLKMPVNDCVITVPAYFNNNQREITKKAGELAGWNVLQIINEPTSASLAYNLVENKKESQNVLVFDFGGGTLDITILNIIDNAIEIKTSHGNNHLGGNDIDNNLLQFCLSQFIKQNNLQSETKNILQNKYLLQQLKLKCEEVKILLSSIDNAFVSFKKFYHNIDLNVNINKDIFIKINSTIFDKCNSLISETLEQINYDSKNISDVIFIGGSTRIPKIYDMLQSKFPSATLHNKIDPDVSVAYGACIHCNNIINNSSENFLVDVISHNIGIGIKDMKYNDEIMHVLINKNSIIPYSHTEYFTTTYDNQKVLKIKIFEGENLFIKDNLLIKEIVIDNIPSKPAGEYRIKITLSIDANNILQTSVGIIN